MKTVSPMNSTASAEPDEDPGARSLTALDDFLQAMHYAEMVVKESWDMKENYVLSRYKIKQILFFVHTLRYNCILNLCFIRIVQG